MPNEIEPNRSRPPVLRRAAALMVLILVAVFVFHAAVHLVMAVFWVVAVIAVIVAVLWAVNELL